MIYPIKDDISGALVAQLQRHFGLIHMGAFLLVGAAPQEKESFVALADEAVRLASYRRRRVRIPILFHL